VTTQPTKRTRTLVMLLLVVVAPSLGALSALWLWPGATGSTIYLACKAVLYGLPAVVAWKTISKQDIRAGIRRGLRPSALLFGLISGVLIGGGIIALWFGWLDEKVDTQRLVEVIRESGMDQATSFWLFAAWLCLGNSLLEEFVFRWFVDGRLHRLGTPVALALPISALIFTAHHIIVLAAYFQPMMVLLGSSGVFIGGLVWSWSLRRWGSLLPGWISHAIVDIAIFVIGASILGLFG
jgi:membrane protease YdiL (CAAX protease family)